MGTNGRRPVPFPSTNTSARQGRNWSFKVELFGLLWFGLLKGNVFLVGWIGFVCLRVMCFLVFFSLVWFVEGCVFLVGWIGLVWFGLVC